MLRNQTERHEHRSGRWAVVSGAADAWILDWSGGASVGYRSVLDARCAAQNWTEGALSPTRALTLPLVESEEKGAA
jgi:hypothetical protein